MLKDDGKIFYRKLEKKTIQFERPPYPMDQGPREPTANQPDGMERHNS